ncbi:MAG: low molecular weight phosphotyrosine protein phosphatase [Ectothiorhodospiraceae bacterium]|nr:low molecular weight phosphotyrosine protein phosphatase [Ectothiorhodospiraceae bacterium]
MNTGKHVKVLFVCMGNICRSPTAEGVFAKQVKEANLSDHIEIDSAGTHAYHIGDAPDARSQKTALNRGIDLSRLKARRAVAADFDHYDYVLAMDRDNYQRLEGLCPAGSEYKLQLFLSFAPNLEHDEVPDPYYGGSMGFERVLDMIEVASEGLLQEIQLRYLNG